MPQEMKMPFLFMLHLVPEILIKIKNMTPEEHKTKDNLK